MIYPFSLGTALAAAGLLLLVLGAAAAFNPASTQRSLRAFPRSRVAGTVLLILAAAWSWLLIANIDLGEFSNWRSRILILIPIAAYLTWRYVEEFLAARALGMVLLLAAEPALEAAWMRPETMRLTLVVLAYAAIIAALFYVGVPYVLRDHIAWLSKNEGRWRAAAFGTIGYGALLLISLLTLHRSS